MPLPERDRPAQQPVYDVGNRSNIIFVTVCTKNRQKVLANDAMHELLQDAWQQADHFVVGRYMLLPDHIHLFCAPGKYEHLSIMRWAAYWKSLVSKQWPVTADKPIWQNYLWDTQLRRGESYSTKWQYVRKNPVRHGLVAQPEDWPWQGELTVLQWHD